MACHSWWDHSFFVAVWDSAHFWRGVSTEYYPVHRVWIFSGSPSYFYHKRISHYRPFKEVAEEILLLVVWYQLSSCCDLWGTDIIEIRHNY
jgi:hypothetical protein